MGDLAGRTLFMSGGSRGIGLAIAQRAARDGANVALMAKTAEPHPKLPGTIYTAAKAIEEAGGTALPIVGDLRYEDQILAAVEQTTERFGSIDICVNNASAINLSGLADLEPKRYDLMQSVNARATFLCIKACLPHLQRSKHAHVLTLSPPINMDRRWFAWAGYTLSKYGMTMLTLGAATELAESGGAANCLWPRTTIATAAIENMPGGDQMVRRARKPEIVADAAHVILSAPPDRRSGETLIDDEVLVEAGVDDLSGYAVSPGTELQLDFFLDDWAQQP
jgi:citronellol/citronellal dehydrogenase